MRNRPLRWFLLHLVFGALLSPVAMGATDETPADSPAGGPAFRLCVDQVRAVGLVERDGGVSVAVRLSPAASRAFSRLARRTQGQPLLVLVDDEPFTRATVHASVDIRRLISTPRSQAEARALKARLQGGRSEKACGRVRVTGQSPGG